MIFLTRESNNNVSLALYIQPKAPQNAFLGLYGEQLKLAVTALPVDGKANKAVIIYLAKFFGVPKSSITIKSGQQSRHKRCIVQGVTLEEAEEKLNSIMK